MSLNRMTASDADGTVYVSRVVEAINLAVARSLSFVPIAQIRNTLTEVEPDVRWIVTRDGKLDSAGGSSRSR